MASKNKSDHVDMIFGGHDHCYHRELNASTNVFLQKSGTDFECFTNLIMLTGVNEDEFESFQKKFLETKPNEDIELFYSKTLSRMFISERVNISNRFAKCPEIDAHISTYTT